MTMVDSYQLRLFGVEPRISDEYWSPRWLFDLLDLRFDLDPAAPTGGVPWLPADDWIDVHADGLAHDWHGRVWLNPPYSDSAPWVERFIAHGNGIALLPHSRARWHSQLWDSDAALADVNTAALSGGRSMFQFVRNGAPTNIYMPVFLAAFGQACVAAIARCGRVR